MAQVDREQHQLGDPIAGRDLEARRAVSVEQQHSKLAAVAGVDQPGSVDERDPVPSRQPGPRQHKPGAARGDLDRDPGRDGRPLPGAAAPPILERAQVEPRVAGVRARRQDRARVEPH